MGTVWRVSQAGRGRGRGGAGGVTLGPAPGLKKKGGWHKRSRMGWGLQRPSLFPSQKSPDPCPASVMDINL